MVLNRPKYFFMYLQIIVMKYKLLSELKESMTIS